jgi:hypothetical protein
MSKKTLFLSFIFLIIISPLVQARQSLSFNFNNELSQRASTPQSPEAAAFARFGDVGVSMYTGTPNVSVPMYTHQGRELNLPINLSYDASGVKVNQRSTLTGLGWNLQVGGRISRQVNGLPDDFHPSQGNTGGYISWYNSSLAANMIEYAKPEYAFSFENGGSKTYTNDTDAKAYLTFLRDVHEQKYETQPDYYNLNVMGLNDTFVFDLSTKEPFSLNNPNIKIQVTSGSLASANNEGAVTFKVTSDNGTIYTFDATEHTRTTKTNDNGSHFMYGVNVYYNSSWYLTKIESPLGKDIYEFEYASYTDNRTREYTPVITEVATIVADQVTDRTSAPSYTSRTTDIYDKKYVRKIWHNDKVIAEVTIANDFEGGPDAAIDKIEIFSDGNTTSGTTLAKVFDLNYSYFKTSPGVNPVTAGDEQVRLKLDEVVIKDADQDLVYNYEFDYDTQDGIASLTSNAQDYLGFYNGADNNPGLIRSSQGESAYPPSYGLVFSGSSSGADRYPNFVEAKKGILTKIKYPTGGYSEFEYEGAVERFPLYDINSTQAQKAYVSIASNNTVAPFDPSACNKTYSDAPGSVVEVSARVMTDDFVLSTGNTGTHRLFFTKTGTATQNGLGDMPHQFVIVKKPNNSPNYTWDEVYDANCNFLLDPADLIFEYSGSDTNYEKSLYLDYGSYQIILLSYDPGFSKTLELRGPDASIITGYEELDRAGIRIKNITDYTQTGIKAKEKEFTYNSAIAITRPIFEYITDERYGDISSATPGGDQVNKDYQILHRVATPLNAGKADIVYPSVTEAIVDFTNPSNTLTKTTNYKTPSLSQGTYGSGSYSIPLDGGTFSATNYSRNPSLGQVRGSSSANTSTTNTFNSDATHYSTFGIALGVVGRNNNYFPTITPKPGGGFRIELQQGTLIPFFSANSYFFTGSGTFNAAAPIDCNGDINCTPEIARLYIHKTNAYGRYAGDVNTSTSTTDGVVTSTTYQYTEGTNRYVKTMVTQGTGSKPQKTVYTYPFEVFEVTSVDPNNEECYTILPDGTIIYICDQSGNVSGTYTYPQLVNANMISQPVLLQQYDGIGSEEKLTSRVLTDYQGVLPQTIFTSRAKNEDFEPRMTFEQYDTENNLLQAHQTDGTPVSFIWGYDNRYVVAKISNIAYDLIPSNIVADIKQHSDDGNQSLLLSSLVSLQNNAALANSMMTYYTYIPNIGVTTMTDETGYRMQYYYDNLQRLDRVEDQEGNVLSENEYNYKN